MPPLVKPLLRSWGAPILRWAGSKRKLLPVLLRAMPRTYARYVEPFVGSGCLFFAIHPEAALLGDFNGELVQTYSAVRDHPRLVARVVHSIPQSKSQYYKTRSISPNTLDPIERAARFIYLNRLCFNGVYRTNRKGNFNVPKGRATGDIPPERHFYRCAVALKSAELVSGDFEKCITRVGKGDFVYLDPPYISSSRSQYGEYGYGSFGEQDITRLLAGLKAIDARNAHFLLSYTYNKKLNERLAHWRRRRVYVRRHIAGFTGDRGRVAEVLVSNYSI